jgi:hypothetical protein
MQLLKSNQKLVQSIKSYLAASKTNSQGKKVHQKLVIIESDDWGAIRTPSKEALIAFQKKGLDIGKSIYKVDALESERDLTNLFDVMSKYKGSDGLSAKMTANCILANPDFQKIKASNYQEFHYEKVAETMQRYPNHANSIELWKKGKAHGIFVPQFHGREHLNYKRWLRVLQQRNESALFCFDWGATYSGEGDYSFMEAYDWDSPEDVPEQQQVIVEGLLLFAELFGESSKSFIAPCYNWDPEIAITLAAAGIKWIQGTALQLAPTGTFDHYRRIRHFFGETNALGMKYNIRNCIFEPSMQPNRDWVNSCMAQIASAFHWQKPAVICSHRINYIGVIDAKNSERGLKDLDVLLKSILKKWPDVIFISTNQLSDFKIYN